MSQLAKMVEEAARKGYSDAEILSRIGSMLENLPAKGEETEETTVSRKQKVSECKFVEIVTKILHEIGIPAHIKGYNYIRSAIVYTVKETDIINQVTKKLYPKLAREYQTTSSRVERAIRHSIEVAWDRGDTEVFYEYFRYTIDMNRGKPTNSEFIAMIADRLSLQYEIID